MRTWSLRFTNCWSDKFYNIYKFILNKNDALLRNPIKLQGSFPWAHSFLLCRIDTSCLCIRHYYRQKARNLLLVPCRTKKLQTSVHWQGKRPERIWTKSVVQFRTNTSDHGVQSAKSFVLDSIFHFKWPWIFLDSERWTAQRHRMRLMEHNDSRSRFWHTFLFRNALHRFCMDFRMHVLPRVCCWTKIWLQ